MTGERKLSKAEYRQRVKAWERACEQYSETQGKEWVAGPATITGKFQTERGSWAEGEWIGDEWRWRVVDVSQNLNDIRSSMLENPDPDQAL